MTCAIHHIDVFSRIRYMPFHAMGKAFRSLLSWPILSLVRLSSYHYIFSFGKSHRLIYINIYAWPYRSASRVFHIAKWQTSATALQLQMGQYGDYMSAWLAISCRFFSDEIWLYWCAVTDMMGDKAKIYRRFARRLVSYQNRLLARSLSSANDINSI